MNVERFALPPTHPLRPYVHGMWKISNAAVGHRERIMPRAVVDLLFPLSGRVVVPVGGPAAPTVLAEAPFVVGLQRRWHKC